MEASRPNRVSGTAGRRISGSPRWRHRPRERGTRSSRAMARRPSAARSPMRSPCAPPSRRGRARRTGASGLYAIPGIARRKTSTPRGSRSCSTRRSMRRRRGLRCTRCCAIGRAMSCSTIWGCAKTRWGSSSAPTAPTFRISCAHISRSRWGCRSDTRSARAAAPGRGRSATNGGTSSTLRKLVPLRLPRLSRSPRPVPFWMCLAGRSRSRRPRLRRSRRPPRPSC